MDQPEDNTTYASQFLKDCAEMLRGRVIFFIPFFGAFVAFMVAKSDYILAASFTVKAACLITFAAGIAYAAFLSETIWLVDALRFATASKKQSPETFTEPDRAALKEGVAVLSKRLGIEYNLFRWMMWFLYMVSFVVIWDLFFSKGFLALLTIIGLKIWALT
jgi:hypothetical protein